MAVSCVFGALETFAKFSGTQLITGRLTSSGQVRNTWGATSSEIEGFFSGCGWSSMGAQSSVWLIVLVFPSCGLVGLECQTIIPPLRKTPAQIKMCFFFSFWPTSVGGLLQQEWLWLALSPQRVRELCHVFNRTKEMRGGRFDSLRAFFSPVLSFYSLARFFFFSIGCEAHSLARLTWHLGENPTRPLFISNRQWEAACNWVSPRLLWWPFRRTCHGPAGCDAAPLPAKRGFIYSSNL